MFAFSYFDVVTRREVMNSLFIAGFELNAMDIDPIAGTVARCGGRFSHETLRIG